MTLEELGYISQIVGVIAVFGSLVYVAIQTRQNGRMMRAKAAWDAQTSFAEINDMLANGGPLSELIFKTLTHPEGLTDYEKHRTHRFLRGVLQRTEAQFALYTNGVLDAEVWRLRRAYIKSLMNNPVFNEIWQIEKTNSVLTRAFIAEMDEAETRQSPMLLGAQAADMAGKEPT
ncbi:MAG: hypothetical protein JNK07_12120 [Alphaproteobacteria bacterium]|nr:hypothetical protein [Alphaproteobacteria bacterium]